MGRDHQHRARTLTELAGDLRERGFELVECAAELALYEGLRAA